MARKLLLAISALALTGALLVGSAQARSLSAFVAPTSVCPHQTDLRDPLGVQVQAMRCMTNFARHEQRLHEFGDATGLDRSAARKNHDIVRCGDFSHYACGRSFTYWMGRSGYLSSRCWRAGENIAWGVRRGATVRAIFVAWIHSPEHRANILGRFSQIGIAVDIGRFHGHREAHVWTQDFGSHCGTPSDTPQATPPHFALRTAYRAQ